MKESISDWFTVASTLLFVCPLIGWVALVLARMASTWFPEPTFLSAVGAGVVIFVVILGIEKGMIAC